MNTFPAFSFPKIELSILFCVRKFLRVILGLCLVTNSISGQSGICTGDYFIFTAADTALIKGCRVINGDLFIENTPNLINTDALRDIEIITGRLTLAFNEALEDVTFASLQKVTELSLFDNHTDFSLHFPILEEVYFVEMLFNTNMKRIEMPNLKTVGFFGVFDSASLEAVIMNDQVRFEDLSLFNNPSLDICCFAFNAAIEDRFFASGNGSSCNTKEEILATDCEESIVELPIFSRAYFLLLGLIIISLALGLLQKRMEIMS